MAGLGSLGKIVNSGVGSQVLGAVAVGAALKGISAATEYVQEKTDRSRFNNVINYAKNKHPELRDVPKDKLMQQMNAFYTLAPKIATNKELGASMLVTTNDYGGNIDLATAKLISEIGAKSRDGKGVGKNDEVLAFVGAGKTVTSKK